MTMLFGFAAALASLSAGAQTSSGPDSSTIVVQGVRNQRQAATEYIDKVLPPSFEAQFGRFEEPLCPDTVGLPVNLRGEVLSRIRRVVTAAGMRLGAEGCTANLLIVVVDDKKVLIEGMRRKKEAYLYGLGGAELKRIENATGPVAAWQISDVIGADGMPLRVDGDGFPRLFTTNPPSRLLNTTRKRLLGAVVVVEQHGLVDVSTRQLADFALVRGVTPIEPRGRAAPSSSVLSLFDGGLRPTDAPQGLTYWDLAFLKALSATRSDIVTDLQRNEIRNKMLREMANGDSEQRQ